MRYISYSLHDNVVISMQAHIKLVVPIYICNSLREAQTWKSSAKVLASYRCQIFCYRVHRGPLVVPVLSLTNSAHTLTLFL
jgi:hypothetical protein